MRLTKAMKINLYKCIVNTMSYKKFTEEEFITKLNEIVVNNSSELFKQVLEEGSIDLPSSNISFTSTNRLDITTSYLSFSTPYITIPKSIFLDETYFDRVTYKYASKQLPEDLIAFKKEVQDYLDDYVDQCNTLWATIQGFTKSEDLEEFYPEFKQFFVSAGITPKPITVKMLPTTTGLPKTLEKFGFGSQNP